VYKWKQITRGKWIAVNVYRIVEATIFQ